MKRNKHLITFSFWDNPSDYPIKKWVVGEDDNDSDVDHGSYHHSFDGDGEDHDDNATDDNDDDDNDSVDNDNNTFFISSS